METSKGARKRRGRQGGLAGGRNRARGSSGSSAVPEAAEGTDTRAAAANLFKVPIRKLRAARVVAEHAPDLLAAVAEGTLRLGLALRQARARRSAATTAAAEQGQDRPSGSRGQGPGRTSKVAAGPAAAPLPAPTLAVEEESPPESGPPQPVADAGVAPVRAERT